MHDDDTRNYQSGNRRNASRLIESHADRFPIQTEHTAAPTSPSDVHISRLSIHDKHPAVEATERIRSSLNTCIEDLSSIQANNLQQGSGEYRALCEVHHDVTLRIRQLERSCSKATPRYRAQCDARDSTSR